MKRCLNPQSAGLLIKILHYDGGYPCGVILMWAHPVNPLDSAHSAQHHAEFSIQKAIMGHLGCEGADWARSSNQTEDRLERD